MAQRLKQPVTIGILSAKLSIRNPVVALFIDLTRPRSDSPDAKLYSTLWSNAHAACDAVSSRVRAQHSRDWSDSARSGSGDVLCEADEKALAKLVEPPAVPSNARWTEEDARELAHLLSRADQESEICLQIMRELNLEMDLVGSNGSSVASEW